MVRSGPGALLVGIGVAGVATGGGIPVALGNGLLADTVPPMPLPVPQPTAASPMRTSKTLPRMAVRRVGAEFGSTLTRLLADDGAARLDIHSCGGQCRLPV
jgi:hypothetical protein